MERQFYESHISLSFLPLFLSLSPRSLRFFPMPRQVFVFHVPFSPLFVAIFFPHSVILALQSTLCQLSRLVRTTSIDYFVAFAMHTNACVLLWFLITLFFFRFLTFISSSAILPLISRFLSLFLIPDFTFPSIECALRSVSLLLHGLRVTLQSTLINELISTS